MKRYYFFILFLLLYTVAFSQDPDQSDFELDSTYVVNEFDDDEPDSQASPDTSQIEARTFDADKILELKSDPTLKFKEAPTIAESLWDRFKKWLGQLIEALFENAVATNWGRILTYVVGIVIAVVLIMMILKVNAFKVFYSAQRANTFNHAILNENIHEMDFDTLIQEARARHDYRLGVRLVFLYALKTLSDNNLIHWDQGKTNHDYLDELTAAELKTGFNELNYYFEYAWYGNFNINQDMFSKVQAIFSEWRRKIK